jgi:hypothetical protein
VSYEVLACEHCGSVVSNQLIEISVAMRHRKAPGFFTHEPPPAEGVPLRDRLNLCVPCSERVLSAVDGPWAVADEDVEKGTAALAAAGA